MLWLWLLIENIHLSLIKLLCHIEFKPLIVVCSHYKAHNREENSLHTTNITN